MIWNSIVLLIAILFISSLHFSIFIWRRWVWTLWAWARIVFIFHFFWNYYFLFIIPFIHLILRFVWFLFRRRWFLWRRACFSNFLQALLFLHYAYLIIYSLNFNIIVNPRIWKVLTYIWKWERMIIRNLFNIGYFIWSSSYYFNCGFIICCCVGRARTWATAYTFGRTWPSCLFFVFRFSFF